MKQSRIVITGLGLTAPNGNTLAVATMSSSTNNIWVITVDIPTLAVKQVSFQRHAMEGGTYSVAWGSDGALLISSMGSGSTGVPLRRYDPSSGTTTEIGSVNPYSRLSASADRATIAVCQTCYASSPVAVYRYDVASQTLASSVVPPGIAYDAAFNHDGTKLAVATGLGLYLYDSQMLPIGNLPSAGVGALLALILFKQDLNVVAIIGIILLIGIVKKNGIMMVDFAMEGEREHGKSAPEAIYDACLLRFRPIMMTTMAALLAGLPLALGQGMGSELRRPLGIAMVGGLLLSQVLTLYTTPVIYIFFDRLGHRFSRVPKAIETDGEPLPAEAP